MNKRPRLCGSTWVNCDGRCNDCSRKYHYSVDKTLFEINSKTALADKCKEVRLEGAKVFWAKLKSCVEKLDNCNSETVINLANDILAQMTSDNKLN